MTWSKNLHLILMSCAPWFLSRVDKFGEDDDDAEKVAYVRLCSPDNMYANFMKTVSFVLQ